MDSEKLERRKLSAYKHYQKIKDNVEYKAKRNLKQKIEVAELHDSYIIRLLSKSFDKSEITEQMILDKRFNIIKYRNGERVIKPKHLTESQRLSYSYVKRLFTSRGFKHVSDEDIENKRNQLIKLRYEKNQKRIL